MPELQFSGPSTEQTELNFYKSTEKDIVLNNKQNPSEQKQD